jgi:hypothetical protein
LLEGSDQEESEFLCAPDCEISTDLNPLGARFFGQMDNLRTLREVNKEFRLPSWIGQVPSTVGTAKGGKLKADKWVILFEVVMIPALIQIPFKNDSGNLFRIGVVENLLHLASVFNIIQSLQIENEDIDALHFHLKAYCQGIQDIFPSFSTKPNHHLALHHPNCLYQFGPAP